MKKIYLLSGPGSTEGFSSEIIIRLKKDLKTKKSVAFIASSPNSYDKNDLFVYGNNNVVGMKNHLKKVMNVENVKIIDNRMNREEAKEVILNADVVHLLGGDPFTQLDYIKRNHFDDVLKEYDGILLGTSAGAMNMSKFGYYSKDEEYPNSFFYDALNITDVIIDPHFEIDNMSQKKEAEKFSKEHTIIGVPNASAIRLENNKLEYIGKCYIFADGKLTVEN